MDRFPTARRGYDRAEVDAVMARVDGTLGRAPLMGAPITAQEIGRTRFGHARNGYDRALVDAAMIDAAAALGGAPATGYQPISPTPSGPGLSAEPGGFEPTGYAPRPGPGAPADDAPEAAREGMLARLRDAKFPTSRLRAGYDVAEVDRFIDYAVAALTGSAPPLTPAGVQATAFKTTTLRGYDEASVDALLDDLVIYLERYGSR